MWIIRMLNGQQAGTTFELQVGKSLIGRGSDCQIKINTNAISKHHAEFIVFPDTLTIKDLNSRNGTYVNGVRIKQSALKADDVIGIHDLLFDILEVPADQGLLSLKSGVPSSHQIRAGAYQPTNARQTSNRTRTYSQNSVTAMPADSLKSLLSNLNLQLTNKLLPGIYKLTEITEFKYVLSGFILLFILAITLLSLIPMSEITRSSIEVESQRRALTIARNLKAINEAAVIQGSETAFNTRTSELEEGVTKALIINNSDGSIIAPANKAGSYEDLPFIHRARRESKEVVEQLDSNTVAASVPIPYFNTNNGEFMIKANAIVFYDMGTLAINDSRIISLFIQTFSLALIIGAILIYFLYQLVAYPLQVLNSQLDNALKDNGNEAGVDYKFPPLQKLAQNINSLLTRVTASGSAQNQEQMFVNKDNEATNIVNLFMFPAFAINSDGLVIAANQSLGHLLQINIEVLSNNTVQVVPDQAFQKNVADLLTKARNDLVNINSSNIDFNGERHVICCQAVCGPRGIDYFLFVVNPVEEGFA